jgi:predicted ABC-type transport system involved in lysophospholipase L1 biosynthesis ATPase subunit
MPLMSSPIASGGVSLGETVLESRGLKKHFRTGEKKLEVLTDVNLELREGEMVAIVAP